MVLVALAAVDPRPVAAEDPHDPAVHRLARALTYETVSREDRSAIEYAEYLRFHDYLQAVYPRVHQVLEREVVNGYSLLYTWRGSNAELAPLLLAAHLDVVPAEESTLAQWTHPPFAGVVADDKVWGRGALDNKVNVIAILEAVERFLSEGFTPERTILLAFGHDEEIGGHDGAQQIGELLQRRGIELAGVLDEGGGIIGPDLLDGFSAPIALIGVAEKGEVNLRLVVDNTGPLAHSAMPPSQTPVGVLAAGIARLEAAPFRARLAAPVTTFLDHLASHRRGFERLALRHHRLFGRVLKRQLSASPLTNAMIRTTMAPTMIRGSEKPNSIAATAVAVVNVRILQGDTIDSVIAGVRQRLADSRIGIEVMPGTRPRNPSPISPTGSWLYGFLEDRIRHHFPNLEMVSPVLNPGGSDARHYAQLTPNVLRFSPSIFDRESSKGPHGVDEWVRIEDYHTAIRFFTDFLRSGDGFALQAAR